MRHFRDFRDSFLRRGLLSIYLDRFLRLEGAHCSQYRSARRLVPAGRGPEAPLGKRGPEIPEMLLRPEIPEMSTTTMRGDKNAW